MTTPFPLRASVRAGALVFVSGQLGVVDGALVDGAADQTDRALANFEAVVRGHGATMADVVKTTVFMSSMEHYADMNAVYGRWFPTDPPARSAFAVRELPLGALVEIEGIVSLPEDR